MGINFIICDDQRSVVKLINESLNNIIKNNKLEASIVLKTTKPDDVLEYARENKPENSNVNAYILDIDLNASKNGLQIAKKVREDDPVSYILFVTAHLEYGMLTFKYKLRVFDYLLKPLDYNDFRKTILAIDDDYKKLISTLDSNMKNFVNIISGYKEYKVPVNEIVFIESKGAKAIIHTTNNLIETYTSLKVFDKKLNEHTGKFYRVHKTYLVNVERIRNINFSEMCVELDTGDKCILSRSNKVKFKHYLNSIDLTIQYNE